ncbi:MAG: PEP-CTERM sorting domain-containing protein [Planctomycetes bacterium]|nr:PEP-CTERM sorting domain-containing protein [Planctomycetota bacterium]
MRATCRTWRVWAALAVVLIVAGPARAFYWHGWPGSQLRVEPTLIGPPVPLAPVPLPEPTIFNPVPPLGPPAPTPEPATAVLGVLGIGALAVRRLRRRG